MAKKDALEFGRKFIEGLMQEAARPANNVTLEDKLKVYDRWNKQMQLEMRSKQGGMGSGFDQQGDDDDE